MRIRHVVSREWTDPITGTMLPTFIRIVLLEFELSNFYSLHSLSMLFSCDILEIKK